MRLGEYYFQACELLLFQKVALFSVLPSHGTLSMVRVDVQIEEHTAN